MSKIVIKGTTIRTFAPRAPRLNLDQVELEPPQMALTLVGDLDDFLEHMNEIAGVYRKRHAVTLTLEWVEQLKTAIGEEAPASKRPRVTDPLGAFPNGKNGRGEASAVAETEPIEHIGGGVQEFLEQHGAAKPSKKKRQKEGVKA